MGIRTHLNLSIDGEPQKVGSFGYLPTEVFLLNNYSIGRTFFDDLPEELEKIAYDPEGEFYFSIEEYSYDGEIQVGLLLKLIERIEKEQEGKTDEEIWSLESWFDMKFDYVKDVLERALKDDLISEYDWVQFKCW